MNIIRKKKLEVVEQMELLLKLPLVEVVRVLVIKALLFVTLSKNRPLLHTTVQL